MANRRMGGFRWRFNVNAPSSTTPPIVLRAVASAYGTVLYDGDPVKLVNDGTVAAAGVGDATFGIFCGAERYYDGSVIRRGGSLPVSTYGTNVERQSMARIIPCRGQVFEIDADDATTATTFLAYQAFIGENADIATGTNVGDQSGCQLDISTHATTNTLVWSIHDIATYPDHDFAAVGVKLLVRCNLIQEPGTGITTGV